MPPPGRCSASHAPLVAALVLGLVALKAAVAGALCRLAGLSTAVAAQVGLTLAEVEEETHDLRGHVLVAGFGRVGRTLARVLESQRVAYVALDLDAERVAAARAGGAPVFFGDAARPEVLRAAGGGRARAAVVTLDDPEAARRTVAALRRLSPELTVLARARDVAHTGPLERTGADVVVPEVAEGSLQLGGALLRALGESAGEAERVLDTFRADGYAALRGLPPPGPG